MADLLDRMKNFPAPTFRLPLTPLGEKNMPCHPIEEMDIDEIESTMRNFEAGYIQTFSEDELFDLFEHMSKRPIGKEYDFDVIFPSRFGQGIDNGSGPYKLAYCNKGFEL